MSGAMSVTGTPLVSGQATGQPLVLSEPLSFWGGVEATTGIVVDTHHPQVGASIVGRVLVMPSGRGSSSSSSVLAEVIRNGAGPAAIVLGAIDPIIVLGCLVAHELYGSAVPVVVLSEEGYRACASAATSERPFTVHADDGRATVDRISESA